MGACTTLFRSKANICEGERIKKRERKIRTTKKLFKTCFRCFRRKEEIIIRICAILGSVCVYHTPDITIYIYRYDIIMTVHFIL